jgi:hypothetical protein
MQKNHRLLILPLALALISLACGGSTNSSQESTLQAISDQVRQTGTAAALAEEQGNTADQSAAATQTALAAINPDSLTGTAAANGPILAELPTYGVDPNSGHVAWMHPPVSLEVAGFMKFDFVNHFISIIAQDFVISADISWDAIGSESSCGFVLRSDGNEDAMNTYLATISRVASGHFLFLTVAKGEVVTGQDIYAYGRDPAFDWQNNATNNLTVVGRSNRFFIYTNGTMIGEIDPSAPPQLLFPPEPDRPADTGNAQAMAEYAVKQAEYDVITRQIKADYNQRLQNLRNADTTFDRGFMAMVALSRAGKKATCQFNNAWLFLIEK